MKYEIVTNITEKKASMPGDRPNDGYEILEASIRKSFSDALGYTNDIPLYTTNVENLFEVFLENIPAEGRQHYNCNACRNFVNRYGGLVTIDDTGNADPVMWNFIAPDFFMESVAAVVTEINKAKVNGVFITDEKRLGTPRTGIWTHMAVEVPREMRHKDRLKTPYQKMAEKNEESAMLARAIYKYNLKTVETAVNLLRSNSLYRSEKVLGIAEWFLDIHKNVKPIKNKQRYNNLIWKKANEAPAGFCHITSSMIGTLLDDIEAGCSYTQVKQKFDEKMSPTKYQRPQAAPSRGNVARAEEIIAKLGLENSLKRRYAYLSEVKTLWVPLSVIDKTPTGGVFADVLTKQAIRDRYETPRDIQPCTTMTWNKFQRTVLHNATKIEFKVPVGFNSYSAIVTAEDPDAPPIILWDNEEKRNPFTWYLYASGSYPTDWNLMSSKYVEVKAVVPQPNMWQAGYEHNGEGVFFILDGCRDVRGSKTLALFPELLRRELHEVRSTIEAFSKTREMAGKEDATACGLLLQSGSNRTWKCELRVTTDVGVANYRLDRWD